MGNFTAQMAFHLANEWSTTYPGNFLAHPQLRSGLLMLLYRRIIVLEHENYIVIRFFLRTF